MSEDARAKLRAFAEDYASEEASVAVIIDVILADPNRLRRILDELRQEHRTGPSMTDAIRESGRSPLEY